MIDILDNLCTKISDGAHKTPTYVNEGIPFLRVTDIHEQNIDWNKTKKIPLEEHNELVKRCKPEKGDILYSKNGTIGIAKEITWEDEFSTFVSLALLKLKKDLIYPKYLCYFLGSQYALKQALSHSKTGTVTNLHLTEIKKIKVPVPSLETQKKIAEILDAADQLRQKDKGLIAKYNELTQSLFIEMFGDTTFNSKGWPIKYMEDLCTDIIDCPHSTPSYIDKVSDYPCIRTTELKKGKIDWSSMKYLDEEGYKLRTKRLIPDEGDIIYGREGTFGEAVIIPKNTKISLGQRVMLFRPKYNIINSFYFHAMVRSDGLYKQAVKKTSGSTVGHINIKDIKMFKCPLPPIELQNQFAERVELIEKQKELAEANLKKSEDLFNSLLDKAFKGELVK